MNAKKPIVTAALAAAGVVLTAGAAGAGTASSARISGHEQLRAAVQAAVQALPAHEAYAPTTGPAGMPTV